MRALRPAVKRRDLPASSARCGASPCGCALRLRARGLCMRRPPHYCCI